MPAPETTKFQVNFKTPSGALINLYADDDAELGVCLDQLQALIPQISAVEALFHGASNVAQVPGVVAAPHQQPVGAAAAPPALNQPAGVEVQTDRYNNKWTYGDPGAPNLPDGRGQYARKDWTDRSGKQRHAWVDPAKGPKPFPAGATEAPIVWISH